MGISIGKDLAVTARQSMCNEMYVQEQVNNLTCVLQVMKVYRDSWKWTCNSFDYPYPTLWYCLSIFTLSDISLQQSSVG